LISDSLFDHGGAELGANLARRAGAARGADELAALDERAG
jgi:hypothetical protein